MKLFKQSLAILSACLIVLLITSTPLDDYKAPIMGFLIIVSIIGIVIKQRAVKKAGSTQDILSGSGLEVAIVTTVLLLTIFMTGGLTSTLFFLLYFLLFGIVFLFKPETVFVLLVGLCVLFFTSLSDGDLVSNLIKLASLVFLSPISYFFGREFQKREHQNRLIEDKTGQIIEDAETLRQHTRNEEALDEIEDIENRAKELRNETKKD